LRSKVQGYWERKCENRVQPTVLTVVLRVGLKIEIHEIHEIHQNLRNPVSFIGL